MRRRIPQLRGWAILAVVAHHATNWGFIAMFWWVHRYRHVVSPNYDQMGTPVYYALTAFNQAALFSVPAFLFISGIFITYAARGASATLSRKVVKARLLNLLWPYLIWSAVIFLGDGLLGTVYTPLEYLRKLATGGAVGAYFFIPLLAQFYLLSPFLVRWAKARPRSLLVLSALIQLGLVAAPYLGVVGGSPAVTYQALKRLDWLFVRWVFFFALGLVVGFRSRPVEEWLARHKGLLLLVTLLLAGLSVLESQAVYRETSNWGWAYTPLKFSSTFYALAFILAFLAWKSWPSTFSRTVERAGGMSYGIYLLHPKGLELASRIVYHVAPGLLARQLLLAFLFLAVGVGVPWLLMNGVARSPARRVYRYLFG
ncbi:MAG TPA: acyltransferase [Anaerolineales bacterium]|nr:acyltransferase [Anaerolineae bacterium]HIQ02289.1 acyltransferase [Anaerolineales bacterium]